MADALERFRTAAEAEGLAVEPVAFPDGTRTAADAAAAVGCELAQIVKSLVLVGDGAPLLVLTSGANRVDEAALARRLGREELRMASASEAREATGYAIGGTPPLGHATDLPVLIDEDLLAFDEVWAAAGTATHVFAVAPQRLQALTDAEAVAVS